MPSRRRYLALLGAGLAGCAGGRSNPTSADSPTPTDAHTNTRTRTDTPTDSPTETATETSTETAVPPDSVDGTWRHRHADPGHTGFTPRGTGPTNRPAELWRVDGLTKGPLVADGTVYTGSGQTVVALDAVTGDRRWARRLSRPDRAGLVAVVDGTLYLHTGSAVRALSAADGSDRWRATFGDYASVVVGAGGVYGATSAALVALEAANGAERWRRQVDAVGDLGTPALGPDAVYVADDASNGKVRSFAASDGTLRWAASAGSHPGAVTVQDSTAFAGGFYGNVYGLSTADGESQWSANAGPAIGSILVGPKRLYAAGHGGDHAMACLDNWSGSTNWTANAYPRAATGDLVFCDAGDHLVALSAKLGEERWRVRAPTGRVAVVDDLCYVAGPRQVVALR